MSFNHTIIEEFRTNAGKVGGPFAGNDLLLLTTTGAKTQRPHTVPFGYVRNGDQLLITGSNLGAPHHPAWYHNLLAHPLVQVEIGTETFEAIAVPAEGPHRDQLFEHITRTAPGYADYQTRTNRTLPVIALQRTEDPTAATREITNLADKLLQVHAWLRAQLQHVRTEAHTHLTARTSSDHQPPSLGMQIRQHCLAFCEFLTFHHTSEDDHIFPALAHHHPHLRDALDRLRAEHRTVANIKDEILALLADITNADPHEFRTEFDRLARELHAHLDYEERTLIPALTEIPWPPTPAT
ncbi:nitroreductase/quinone reductase family protein [Saccharopolyspora pogona]|uniref:nitroreductase/quinone reductase family protein n=1 Tax=Saccharopolyspora pogona TaxID=333966 RepID=UPI0016877CB6|nr:nitroreductase/quinone reductase family protein [Saccharopolyspora pogona]